VTLGGRRVPVDRPRARTVDGHEVPLTSYTPPSRVQAVRLLVSELVVPTLDES
jgi:hypothetical protein